MSKRYGARVSQYKPSQPSDVALYSCFQTLVEDGDKVGLQMTELKQVDSRMRSLRWASKARAIVKTVPAAPIVAKPAAGSDSDEDSDAEDFTPMDCGEPSPLSTFVQRRSGSGHGEPCSSPSSPESLGKLHSALSAHSAQSTLEQGNLIHSFMFLFPSYLEAVWWLSQMRGLKYDLCCPSFCFNNAAVS